eukprot:TRINITY_DN8204_c0_g4_i4.p1 TRINITY_DN8204_c0_g4~~TRINITY_DN8204_c0_g4_i4.p1  ORF type:complete len:533 (-),score=16.18 TRINITY_DN8204_c0_g4_i4:119-1717(-)
MILLSGNMVQLFNNKPNQFQKTSLIQVQRLQRRTNMPLVQCKFSKQPSKSPRKKLDGSKTVVDSEMQSSKILTSRLRKCKDADKVLKIIQRNKKEMNYINIATAFVSIAYIIQQRNRRNSPKNFYYIRTVYLELFSLTEQHVDQMQNQAVANSLWSIGKLVDIFGYNLITEDRVKAIFSKLCKRMLCIVDKMNAQSISNCLWAMGKLRYQYDKYIYALVQVAQRLRDMYPQDISNALWALAVLQYRDVQITNRLVVWAKTYITEMNGQQIANSLWALQELRYYDKNFMDLVEQQILKFDLQFNSQGISNILLAFAESGMCSQDNVVSNLLQKLTQNLGRNVQDYTNSIYALSVLGCPLCTVQNLVDMFTQQYQTKQLTVLSELGLCQLWRAQLYYKSMNLILILPAYLSDSCKRTVQEQQQFLVQQELPFLNTVYAYIKKQGFNCQKRALVQDGQLEINILINSKNGNQIAVMTNGSVCYAINDESMLLGRAKFIIHIIRNFGYHVIEVSENEWKKGDKYKHNILEQIRKYL